MDENLIISPEKKRVSAATLHARYLGMEVFVWQGDRRGLSGKLEALRISKKDGYDGDGQLDQYEVKVVISGRKIALNGADKIILVDENLTLDAYKG